MILFISVNFNIYCLGLPNIESVSVEMVNNTLYLLMTVDDQDTPPATYRAIITPGNLPACVVILQFHAFNVLIHINM